MTFDIPSKNVPDLDRRGKTTIERQLNVAFHTPYKNNQAFNLVIHHSFIRRKTSLLTLRAYRDSDHMSPTSASKRTAVVNVGMGDYRTTSLM